ncbi:MAG: anion permease [Clostridia bacterium]|nr:anion permease [Clostridia bacterium]
MKESIKVQSNKEAKVKTDNVNLISLLGVFLIGLVIWIIPTPAGLDKQAWHLFAIFVATIAGFILKPMPMGSIAILAITLTALTGTLTIKEALSGFSNTTIWLVVAAFFISRGFIKTKLGARISYLFIRRFGKNTLGLSYALLASDLILAPAIPSNTSRGGGVIFPIIRSVCDTYGSTPEDGSERKIGSFLIKSGFQGNLITSAMFMTAMAANPLISTLAYDVAGLEITWMGWFIAALIPGIVSLIAIPYLLYKIYPPEVKETPDASKLASDKLNEMGPMKTSEKYMLMVFGLILILWVFGKQIGLSATTAGLIGLNVLLLTQVLTWEDIKKEQGAWNTLVWFAALVMMANYINKLGMIGWFSDLMQSAVSGMSGIIALLLLALVYYYSHYFFASATAHISAMYAAFLAVALSSGAPPMLSALVLAFFSNLFGSTTHYGAGPAPVFFGSGYVPQNTWWKLGFIISIAHVVIWSVVGGVWWKVLGLW